MKKIMFTKHLEGRDLKGIIAGLKAATVEGADLCVREGCPVNPENVSRALPEAARAFADEGLVIPLVTAPGDFTRPDIDYAEEYYAACGEAGVGHIKLGYWHWTPEKHYWDYLDEIRGFMDGFQRLSEKTGVKTVVHNHSGKSMGLHSVAAMNVVKGYDPEIVTKSGLMLGLGESGQEVRAVMGDLRAAGCDLLTIGQYLQPSAKHHPVVKFIPPEEFAEYRDAAKNMGFKGVTSAPLVRSSFRATEIYAQARGQKYQIKTAPVNTGQKGATE